MSNYSRPQKGQSYESIINGLIDRIERLESVLPTETQLAAHPGLSELYEKFLAFKTLTEKNNELQR